MPEVKLSDVEGLRAWANIVINNQEAWVVPEVATQIDIYNADETAYLVINVYPSKNTVNQYSFIPAKEEDDAKTLVMLFDFLKSVDFSLAKLLQWLADAPFDDAEADGCVFSHGLAIQHDFFTNTETRKYQ